MKSISFAKEKLRPGTSYQLTEWNGLNPEEQQMLAGLYDEAEVYGAFRPAHPTANLTHKVAYKEVALLYMHLQHTDKLPRYIYSFAEDKSDTIIAQLVLDSVLEIEYEGNFVCGTAAVNAIFGETLSETTAIPNRLSLLSMEGIRYAFHLCDLDMRSLSNRLYTFNTMPMDVYSKSKFLAEHAIKEFLFSSFENGTNSLLNGQWESNNSSEEKYWLSWWKPSAHPDYPISTDKPTYKLYISPLLNDLPKVLHDIIPVLSLSAAFSFKIGATIQGLLRPDKMVAYFENRDDLMEAAALIKKKTAGYHAQGVPFTAQIDDAGILSWGVDPSQTDVLSAIEAGSWRVKVTDQLALAIIQAQTDQLDWKRAIHFIRAKLFSVGISTEDWTSIDHHEKKLS